MIKCYRVTVHVLGGPVEFPIQQGEFAFNEMRVSTLGNVGNVFIASDSSEAMNPDTRFPIAPNVNLTIKVSSMNNLWLNVLNAGDAISIIAELKD